MPETPDQKRTRRRERAKLSFRDTYGHIDAYEYGCQYEAPIAHALGTDEERERVVDIIKAHIAPLPADDPRREILADVATDVVCGPEDPNNG